MVWFLMVLWVLMVSYLHDGCESLEAHASVHVLGGQVSQGVVGLAVVLGG
jgi:hypothetical protein